MARGGRTAKQCSIGGGVKPGTVVAVAKVQEGTQG